MEKLPSLRVSTGVITLFEGSYGVITLFELRVWTVVIRYLPCFRVWSKLFEVME